MTTLNFLKVCAVILLSLAVSVAGQSRCRICNAAGSLDECTHSVTCAPDEECYMDEKVTEQLSIEYTSGCRAKDVCKSAASSGQPIGKRGLQKRAGGYVVCSRCCDAAPKDGKECNTKLCGIRLLNQNSSQCYFCDSTKAEGQGDVTDPTTCSTYTTCQTDEVCGSETFVLASNSTHRMTCLSKRLCTLLTQKALEDIKRCMDPANVAAGLCGNRRRSGQMVCSACCGDAVCNSGTCDDVLQRLYNLWDHNALNFATLKTNGTLPSTNKPTTKQVPLTTKLTSPVTKSTAPTTKLTTTTTKLTSPTTKSTPPTTKITTTTKLTSPTTTSTAPTTKLTTATTKLTSPTTKSTPPTIKITTTTKLTSPTTKSTPPTVKIITTTKLSSPTTKSTAPTTKLTTTKTKLTTPITNTTVIKSTTIIKVPTPPTNVTSAHSPTPPPQSSTP